MALGWGVCDQNWANQYDTISRADYSCSQWTKDIATVRQVVGESFTGYRDGELDFNEYHGECDPMVYNNADSEPFTIIGSHYGSRVCLGAVGSTFFSYDKAAQIGRMIGISMGAAEDFARISGIMQSPLFDKFKVVDKTYGPTTGLTVDKIVKARSLLGVNCVPMGTRVTVLAGSDAIPALFADKVLSAEYSPGYGLMTAKFPMVMNMQLRFGPITGRSSIPKKGDDSIAIVIAKDDLIQTYNMPLTREINKLHGRIGLDFLSEIMTGVGVSNPSGIVLIKYDEKNEKN